MATPIAIVAYLGLFVGIAVVFLFANLLIGRLLRPRLPNAEKLEIYECGEPTIGSSFVQFDLRFYVVALLFIIFDVEVAFFFPWATVYGKATHLASPNMPVLAADADPQGSPNALSPQAIRRYQELGVSSPVMPIPTDEMRRQLGSRASEAELNRAAIRSQGRTLAATAMADIGVFFAVLMTGFFYVWKRGDLDWVRSVSSQKGQVVRRAPISDVPASARDRPSGSILSA